MSFELTDEEKNLFIQNGFDRDRVCNWIDMQYFDGKSEAEVDFELREMIDSLKGVTPTSASDAENISKWQQKGTIGAYEFAKMNTFVDKDGVTKWQPKNTDINESVQPVGNNAGEKANLDTMFKPVKELADKANRFAANAAKNWTYRQILAGQHDVTGRDGKIGFWEAMGKNYSTATVLPFVGGYLEGAQKEWITEIAEKIDNDTPLTWQEELVYETLVNKVKEERTRGYSIMGGIGDSLLPSLIRFGGEMALSGGVLKGVGLMNKAAKANGIRGKFFEGLKDMGKLGAAGVVLNPSEIYSAYQARDFDNKMRLTPEGEMLFAQSQEAPATTLIKSLADVALSFACEGSGKSISAFGQGAGKVGGYVVAKLSDPVNQYLAKNKNLRNVIETVYPKILDMAQKAKKIGDGVNAKTAFLADKVRFDGFLEEIGEEKLENFLSTALGLQKENPTFDDLLQSLGGSGDEWAILCGTVALQGGALSLTSRVLQKHLGNVGMTDTEIEEVVNTLSETEKKSLVKNMLDKGIIDANTAEKIQSSEFWEDAKQKLYEEFSAQGSDEQKAKLAAELFSFMGAFKAEYGGVSDEEAFAELGTVKTEDYRNKEISDAVAERARTKREFAENFKNSNYLADFLDAENISQSEYENLSDEEKRDFALAKAMEIYDAEHQGLENERLPQDSEPTVLTGRVEYNEEEENQAPQKPLTDAQIDNLARELAEFDESGETIGAFLSVLENDTNTDNIEILKNAIQSIPASADLINFINSKTQNKVYNQSAMYKSPLDNFNDFYNQVFEKEAVSKKNKSKVEKSYFEYKTENVDLRIPHDTVVHVENGHGLQLNEWADFFNNISTPTDIAISNKPRYDGSPLLLKYNINGKTYGAVIEFFENKKPILTTVFSDTEKKVSDWIKENSHSQAKNTSSVTAKGMLLSNDYNSILSYFKNKLNPSEQTKILYQSAATAGAETSAEISDAQKEWQEKGTGSKYFKKWFGDSKVVDENGQPLVVYHGSPSHDITAFDSDKTLYGEISKGFNFFTNKKSAYQNSADDYANFAGTNGYRRNGKVYETYLKIQKPLHIKYTSNGMSLYNGDKRYSTPVEYYDTNYKEIKEKYNNGDYDGIIIENTDKNDDDSIIYLVPNSEQIKSVNNRGTFDESNPNIYFQSEIIEPVPESENNNYKNFVQKVFDKKLTTKDKSRPYIIGKTPDKLKEAGISNNDISIGYKVIEKAFGEKNDDHKLNKDTLEKVYEALYSPIAIIKAETNKNETNNNRYSVILDLKNNGDYVLVGIDSDKRIDKNVVNDIRSVHSRKSFFPLIEKAFNENRIRKIKKSKIKDLLLTNQSDSISDGVTSLINSISQKYEKTNIFYQTAYHGSPAKFDQFDLDYIGSGEGAQVHGYGTYVAESKHIADERYRKRLVSTEETILYNGESPKYIEFKSGMNNIQLLDAILYRGKEGVINHLEKSKSFGEDTKELIDYVKSIDETKLEKKHNGQLYEVEIPEDDEMLDEDKPLNEQPDKVKKAILEYYKSRPNDYIIPEDINSLSQQRGKQFYRDVAFQLERENSLAYRMANGLNTDIDENFNPEKEASLLLNSLGIKGIKYDGRTDGQCYVIFNPENIDITRTFYQEGISPKTSQKAKEVVNALRKIADGSEEETVKDLRNDLEQYGGTNDVTFVFGNDKKGIKHIAQKHGSKTLLKVFDTVVDGKVLRYVPGKKTVVLSKGDYEAVLSLDENGNKKTWLLSGWNTKEKSSDVSSEVSTQSTSTQIKPTFSRQDLGAELNNSITNSDGGFNLEQSQKRTGYVFQGPAQPNLFVENAAQNHNKGFVGIDLKGNRGLTDINRNLILIGTTGDITTVLHESAHYFLNMLEELERVPGHSPKVDDALFAIRKTLKNDGTPFTRSQHEKFAKGFEHYIYTGNARNNLFKEIYEDIKNLLKNIYEFVQKGQYFTTGEGALTEEEMKNFNNVFDEIFKLENKTVKERVFAKVLALDEKEEEIRNKQEQELAEIWEIHNQKKEKLRQEKAASEDEKSIQDIRQDAIKYADKKENAKWKEYNEDRKNVAYSILSAATDMPVAEIKRKLHSRYKKTREDIELKLREVGDKLAASGLFEDAKVKEYFGSIDFSEVDASQQLADMARDAIENDVNLDSPLNQDINRVLNQFEYLKKKAEKAKGHQNTLILESMFDMLSDVTNMSSMPSMFVEDLGKTVMSFAEKNEETLDRRTKRAGNKDVFRRYILKKLKDVKLYSKEDKRAVRLSTAHALYAQVATATNASTTERLLRKINNAMIEDIEMRKKSIIAKEIARQLRVNSKIVTTKTRVQRGLYDWKTNSVWQALAEINKMNRSELEANLDKLLTPAARALVNVEDGMHEQNVSDKDNKAVDFSFENKLKKKFITYKLSKNLADVDSALMLDLLSDIIEFKNVARTAKSEKEQTERLQKYELKNDLAERILNAPNAVKILIQRWFGRSRSLQNWDTFLRVCFGEDAVEKYSMLDEETEKVRYEHRILVEFWSKTAAIYGKKRTWALKRWLFDPNGFADVQKLFREYESADNTWGVYETLYNPTTKEPEIMDIELNRAQIITMYAWDQNGLLHKRLINQFGEDTLNFLFGKLSEEDKKFAWLLIDTCSSLRGDINEVMIRSQGLTMVPEENYIPSIVKRQGDAIQAAGIINSRVGNPSATHLRSRSEYIAMRPINPLAIVTSHVDKMSAYVCVSEKAAFVSEIFGAPRLATAFENAFDEQMKDFKEKEKPTKEKTTDGKKLYEMLAAQLAASTYFKYTQAVKTMDDVGRKVINNYLTQAIALKPKIGLSQILSVINYADGNDITIMAWTKNFLHCMSHPLETIKFMKRDEFLQERFKGPLQNETMKSILTEFDKWNNIKTFFTSNVRFADMFAIMFGGKAYIDHLMKNGVSEEEAFRRFRRKTNESQQSTLPSTLSNFQRTKEANGASALVLAFTNTPTQYERKFIEGVAELFREGGDKKTAIKKILLYRIVSPLLFDFILQGLGLWLLWGWFTGDDDKGRLAGKAALSAILCGNSGAYGLLGRGWLLGVMVVINTLYGDRWSSRAANYPILGDAVYKIGKLLEGIIDGDIETADVIASAALALSFLSVPAPAIVNSINGLVDISQGDFAIGLHEFLGWGRGVTREAFE